jgi:hypothetical protein
LRNEGSGLGLGLGISVVIPMASFFPARVSTDTRRPTGATSSHRPWTPICNRPAHDTTFSDFSVGALPPRLLKDDDRKNDVVGTLIDCTAIEAVLLRTIKKTIF